MQALIEFVSGYVGQQVSQLDLTPPASHALHAQLHQKAKMLAEMFQRSSSNVEGRNGYLSLRNHQLRGLDLSRKQASRSA